MIDQFIPQIEALKAEGAVVLLKWDGERAVNGCTVVVIRDSTGYQWRKDCDDISIALTKALRDYKERHAH